jgi:microsomal epoxide hydrolase
MLGAPPSADVTNLTEEEQRRMGAVVRFQQELSGYLMLQAQRPQTLAYALNDSPIGQLAWIVEKVQGMDRLTDRSGGCRSTVTRGSLT